MACSPLHRVLDTCESSKCCTLNHELPVSPVTPIDEGDLRCYSTAILPMGGDPFTITDAHSRYLIRCQIVSRIDLSQVRAICKAAMREYGRPSAD